MHPSIPWAAAFCLVAAAPAGAATLADVRRALAAVTTMSADFTQTAADGTVLRGRMDLKQPGRIRFDYAGKVPYLIVSDGRTLSFVDYKVAQVSQWPLRSTPLGVLLDPKADLARVARVVPESESPVPGMVAVAARDPARPDMGAILVLLRPDAAAPGGLMLTGWRVLDAQGNFTAVELSGVRYNQPVDDRRFRFNDPRAPRFPGRG
jgi:outer membrane lipoprotein-sorting protein